VDRVVEVRTTVEGPAPASEPLHSLRHRVKDLARDGRETCVDEVRCALLEARHAPPLAALIHELLEQHHLQHVRDSHGRTLRFILVDALLDLGFPHALEVRPEDLEYFRVEQPLVRSDVMVGGFTWVAGFVSLLWAVVSMKLLFGHIPPWGHLPLLIAGLHAAAAVISATRVVAGRRDRLDGLKLLGGLGLLGPATVAWAEHAFHGGLGAAALAGPFTLTALLCAVTSARLR
jgi:hypothetical protein